MSQTYSLLCFQCGTPIRDAGTFLWLAQLPTSAPAPAPALPELTEADWTEIYYAFRDWWPFSEGPRPVLNHEQPRLQLLGLLGPDGQYGPNVASVLGSSSWSLIRQAINAKLAAPVTQGDDYMARLWRAHLRRILDALPQGGA